MAHHEAEHHHDHFNDPAHAETPVAPGFGRNTGGTGILIIAVVAVVFFLSAWWLWNDGKEMNDHYRLMNSEATTHGEAGGHDSHGNANDHVPAAMHADTNMHNMTADTTHANEMHTADSTGGH